jgi:hypothetical protein
MGQPQRCEQGGEGAWRELDIFFQKTYRPRHSEGLAGYGMPFHFFLKYCMGYIFVIENSTNKRHSAAKLWNDAYSE